MIIIVCVDNNNGIAFNGRRQSQDATVCQDIARLADGHKLWATHYGSKLFRDNETSEIRHLEICVADDPMTMAKDEEFVFLDADMPSEDTITQYRPEAFIIYHWNTTYPADRKLNINRLIKSQQERYPSFHSIHTLHGEVHETITREILFLTEMGDQI